MHPNMFFWACDLNIRLGHENFRVDPPPFEHTRILSFDLRTAPKELFFLFQVHVAPRDIDVAGAIVAPDTLHVGHRITRSNPNEAIPDRASR